MIDKIAFALMVLCPAERAFATDPLKCYHFQLIERTDIKGRTAGSDMHSHDICIPEGYFQSWQKRDNVTTDLAINAYWPSMTSVWDKPLPGRSYDPVSYGNMLNIWFALSSSFPSVDMRFHASKRLFEADLTGRTEFGLLHTLPNASVIRPEAELYFAPEDFHTFFISCHVRSYVPYPGCNEEFEFRTHIVTVNYSRTFLPFWKQIELKTKELIASFDPSQ